MFYRLRQVDFDGTEALSPVRMVQFDQDVPQAGSMVLYPNPTLGSVNIAISNADQYTKHQVQVTDQMGRVLQTAIMEGDNLSINLENDTTGIYFITVDDQSFKVVKK